MTNAAGQYPGGTRQSSASTHHLDHVPAGLVGYYLAAIHSAGLRSTPMTARDLFVSHSSDDAEAARALRTVLEDAGYTCWMAPDDIVGTETWTEQILGAIADSKAMLVLVSTASNKSPHVSREVNLALGKGRPVLPIRIEDVAPGGSLEYLLSLVQRVDAFPPPVTVHRDRILRRLDTIVARPAAAALDPGSPPAPAPVPVPVPAPEPVPTPGPRGTRDSDRRSGPPLALLVGGGAVALLLAVVVGSKLLGPGPSPQPSGVAVATQVAGASGATPTGPAGTAEATSTPLSLSEQQLQAALPSVTGIDACTSWPTPPGGDDVLSPSGYAASTARLTCPGPTTGAPAAEYALYSTGAELKADYDSIMSSEGVAAAGTCVSAIPANAPWNFPTYESSGDLACFERNGGVQYVWTQKALRILGQWLAPDNASGLAFWKNWTMTFNRAELSLVADLPDSVDALGSCVRGADRYYEAALAIIACPRESGQNSAFYARFESADAFPNDPMTTMFDSILTDPGFPDDTSQGCLSEPATFGRTTWGYGASAPTEGAVGCYERTDGDATTVQVVWTFNRLAIMGLWNAPDLASGVSFFKAWTAEVR